jgi:uncharacterized membrane protein YhhN
MDWYAVFNGYYRWRYFSKPLVLIFLILWFFSAQGWSGRGFYFGFALIFSLVGDIFLLKGLIKIKPTFFQFGLAAFLFTQILYIIGFNREGLPPLTPALTTLIIITGISILNGKSILQDLQKTAEGTKLIPPIIIYMTALSLMVVSGVTTLFRSTWLPAASLLSGLGAILFYLSDSILAHDKFGEAIRGSEVLVTVTYHLGQIAIIAGYLQH